MASDSIKTLSAGPGRLTATARRPVVGDIIAEKFRLERLLGRGGMGFVMAARHIELDELFAIKFIENRTDSDVVAAGRFYREARATLRLKNEHVVRVFDASAGQGESMPYIIMEYLEGANLAAVLARSGVLPVTQAIDYVLQACEAIAEAHMLGIVHRDIKPSNIVLTAGAGDTPFIKVLDFGISTGPNDKGEVDFTLTETGAVFGSAAYMSPEQLRSTKHVDHRADVWSLGVVLHELVCGAAPFDAESSVALSIAIAMDAPLPMRQMRPDAPPELERIVLACLEKDREARVQSVAELANLLRPLASPRGVQSCDIIERIASAGPPPSLPVPSARPSAPLLSFGKTEPQVPPQQVTRSSRRSTTALIGAFVAVAALSGLVASRLGVRRAAANATTQGPPSAVLVSASMLTEPSPPPPPIATVIPVKAPSATSSSSSSKTAASLALRPRPQFASGAAKAGPKDPGTSPGVSGSAAPATTSPGAPAASANRPVPNGSNGSDPDLRSRF